MSERWVLIDVERALAVDRGRDVIIVDNGRGFPGRHTILVRLSPEAQRKLVAELVS